MAIKRWLLTVAAGLMLVVSHIAAQETAPASGLPRDIFGGIVTQPNDMDAWHTGVVKSLGDNSLVVEGKNFKPNALVGKVINPNFKRSILADAVRYSNRYYRIVANTADTIQTNPEDGRLTEFARAGDTYLMAGFFRLQKNGQRWVMFDPLDHPFLNVGVCAVGPGYLAKDTLQNLYGGSEDKWWTQAVERIKSVGWTCTIGYAIHAFPGWPKLPGYREGMMPYWRMVRSAENEGMRQKDGKRGYLDSPLKSILDGVYGRKFCDVFDPSFAKAYGKGINHGWGPGDYSANDPWIIGYITEESDDIFGLLRPDFHLGWCALAAKPLQEKDSSGKIVYSDPKCYTKHAAVDFLKNKYGTIEKLNEAWGSKYTSFGSEGGWGKGAGLLDEDGKLGEAWMGEPIKGWRGNTWKGANANCRADLMVFQSMIHERFYRCEYEGLKSHSPNHLIMGWSKDGPYAEDYWAESRWVDITFMPPPKVVMETKDTGKNVIKPCLVSGYLGAELDSPFRGIYPDNKPNGRYAGTFLKTQAQRGQRYSDNLLNGFDTAAADGTKPVVGIVWWAWVDDPKEKRNWGLVTARDNLYDGKQATKLGADGKSGTWDDEEDDFGDCVSKIREANREAFGRLTRELSGAKTPSSVAASRPTISGQTVPDDPDWNNQRK